MKSLLSSCLALIVLVGCQDRPVAVRIEEWSPLEHPIDRLREMAPDRPLMVFFYSDWDLGAQVILREMKEPQVYDLLTEYKVPLSRSGCRQPGWRCGVPDGFQIPDAGSFGC